MNELDSLKAIIGNAIATLQNSLDKMNVDGIRSFNSFEVDTRKLDEKFLDHDIRNDEYFKEIFEKLKKVKGAVLYWIELPEGCDNDKLIDSFVEYNSLQGHRATPALKVHLNQGTRILYVGKVKGTFWGRVIQHLGFFTSAKTQGLQIYHWTKECPMKLTFHYVEFKPDMANIMGLIEFEFARVMKPLIGKHK